MFRMATNLRRHYLCMYIEDGLLIVFLILIIILSVLASAMHTANMFECRLYQFV